jgi:hypothetical protein
VISWDDPEFAAIDDYIRTQLAEAAQTYASKADLDIRLEEILKAEETES